MSDDPTRRHHLGPDGPVAEPAVADPAVAEPAVADPAVADPAVADASAQESAVVQTPRRTAGWRGVALVVAAFAVVLVAIAGLATRLPPSTVTVVATPTPEPLPVDPEAGLLATRAEVEQRAAWGRAGIAPFAQALDGLIADADARLGEAPRPQEPLDIRGTEGAFVDDSASAYGLALAFAATGDERYARHAADYLRAWSTTTKSTAHTCVADGDCQTSLIIGRTAPAFVFAAELIEPSGAMTPADRATFDEWLRTVILPTASERDNNWGDAGTFMRLAIGSYLADAATFDAARDRWREMMDLIPAEGYIPEEVRRGSSGITYTQEALQYKVASAVLAARRGVDLWSYTGAQGGTLKGALDYLASFADPDARWPWHPSASFPTPSPIWELIYAHWRDPAYFDLVSAGRPFGDDGHSAIRWTTIASAAAPDGVVAVSPGGSIAPSAVPVARPTPTAVTPTPMPTPTPTPTAGATEATTTPATLDPPVVSQRTGPYSDLRHLPMLVDWKKAPGDVRRYQVERYDDGRRTDRTNVASGHTALEDRAPTGVDLAYQVRVSVRGAGTSAWSATTLHLRFIDDDDRDVAYDGAWQVAGHQAYEGDRGAILDAGRCDRDRHLRRRVHRLARADRSGAGPGHHPAGRQAGRQRRSGRRRLRAEAGPVRRRRRWRRSPSPRDRGPGGRPRGRHRWLRGHGAMNGLGALPILFVLTAAVFGPLTAWLAMGRDRSAGTWLVLGALAGPLATAVLLLGPPGRCPACGTEVAGWPATCGACGHAFPPASLGAPTTTRRARSGASSARRTAAPMAILPAAATTTNGTAARSATAQPATGTTPATALGNRPSATATPAADRGTRGTAAPAAPAATTARSGGRSRSSKSRQRTGRTHLQEPGEAPTDLLATAMYVTGSRDCQPGLHYLLTMRGSSLAILGPLETDPHTTAAVRPVSGLRVTAFGDGLLITDARGVRGWSLGFQRFTGGTPESVERAILAAGALPGVE